MSGESTYTTIYTTDVREMWESFCTGEELYSLIILLQNNSFSEFSLTTLLKLIPSQTYSLYIIPLK